MFKQCYWLIDFLLWCNFLLDDESSFKKKQKLKMSSLKGKDHNWNTLFLGVNAVAEIMADKYSSNKSEVLDIQSKGGLALRMALGETQVVAETKEFLLKHGVKLDVFGQVGLPKDYFFLPKFFFTSLARRAQSPWTS